MTSLFSKAVIRNFGALLTLQACTYLLPLILIPFLVRVLGLPVFGDWMFALAFVVITRTFVTYGFDLTATRQVAAGGPAVLSELLSTVIVIRFAIWLLSFVAIWIASLAVARVGHVWPLIVAGMLILPGEILFPAWLFQGMEKMSLITKIKLGAKVLNLIMVISLVQGPEDVMMVPALEAVTSLIAGIVAIIIAITAFQIERVRPKLDILLFQIKDGWPVFITMMSVQLYTSANLIVLGFIGNASAVGHYAVAEKIYSAVRGLTGPLVQALFPAMVRLDKQDKQDILRVVMPTLKWVLLFFIFSGIMLYIVAPLAIQLVAGADIEAAIQCLRVFSLAFPFAFGSFLASILIIRRASESLMGITIIGALIGLALIGPMVHAYGAVGAATTFLMVQIYNSVALFNANRRFQK